MIDLGALRGLLAAELDGRTIGLGVHARGIDGAFQPPVAVLGQPDVEFDVEPCHVHRYTLPVAVAVGRPGFDEAGTQAELEGRWLEVAGALQAVVDEGVLDALGVVDVTLTRSDAGSFTVQGQSYPAYSITIEIVG
ncbi:MAG: hypothetical protein QM753_06805 [Thermomicrobiales bacterium]